MHKNTVHYRVRKAEEVRGRSLAEGRLDVEIALLARDLLAGKMTQQTGSSN
jgi:DNA-binding PucR family transcriptional regulator